MSRDRFEAMVARQMRHDDWDIPVVNMTDALKLLRREHAALVRAVKRLQREVKQVKRICGKDDQFASGMWEMTEVVLALLAARKGRR